MNLNDLLVHVPMWTGSMVVVVLLVWREWVNQKMISSLLDRLMARDLREYTATTRGDKVSPTVFIPMDDEMMAEMEDRRRVHAEA